MAVSETLAQLRFDLGICRDTARHAIPPGAAYDLLDYLIDQGGMTGKRGGSAYGSDALAGQDSMIGVGAPEYAGDPRVVVLGSDTVNTTVFDVTTGTAAAGIVSDGGGDENLATMIENKLIWTTDGSGGNVVRKIYLDTAVVTVAPLAGNPPAAKLSCVHLSRLVLANTPDNPNRLWFAPVPLEQDRFAITAVSDGPPGTVTVAGDQTLIFFPASSVTSAVAFNIAGSTGNDGTYAVVASSYASGPDETTITIGGALPDVTADGDIGIAWDIFEGFIDCAGPITALASIGGVLLVWTRGGHQRILGSIPPGNGGDPALENMELQAVDGGSGCIDARSIAHLGGLVYFANEHGVYRTNGAQPESVTTKPDGTGIGGLWAQQLTGFAPMLGAVVCAGVWLNKWLFVSIHFPDGDTPGSGARYQWLFYEPSGAWVRLADGVASVMYATSFAPNNEFYAAPGDFTDAVRLLKLSGLFTPTSSNMSDANGEPVETVAELQFGDAAVLKNFTQGRVTHVFQVGDHDGWAASHAYTNGDVIEAGGALWRASDGVSGPVEPDWAAAPSIGDTVTD